MSSTDFINKLANSLTFAVIINSILIWLINQSFSRGVQNKQAASTQAKKEELIPQNMMLLGFSDGLINLINAILGNIQLSFLDTGTEKVKIHLKGAEMNLNMLLHLVNNILDAGKTDIGEIEVIQTSSRVSETLEKVWDVGSQLIKARNLKGQMRISKEVPIMLELDHSRLIQIMLNLIENATKFTHTGTVYVDVDWMKDCNLVDEDSFNPHPFDENDEGIFERNQALAVVNESVDVLDLNNKKIFRQSRRPEKSSKNSGVLRFTISDRGCGISALNAEKVFGRFTQIDKKAFSNLGTGLGLYVTQELCSKMKGGIRVFSREGIGSSFMVCLPAQSSQLEIVHLTSQEDFLLSLQEFDIEAMVVDDVDFNIVVLTHNFSQLGIQVRYTAKNGQEAYEKYVESCQANKTKIKIITMDIEMPIMNGKTAAQKIREYEIANVLDPCLLIMISGNCNESEIRTCLEKEGTVKADFFLKKPTTIKELLKAISTYFLKINNHNDNDRRSIRAGKK